MNVASEPGLDVRGLSRAEIESRVLESYRCGNFSDDQVRRLLGFRSQFEVHAFLKDHGVYLNYNREDLQEDVKFSDSGLSSRTPRP